MCYAGAETVLEMYKTLTEEKRQGGSYIRISEDGGASWGEAVKVPVSAPHGPIQLKDGSLFNIGREYCTDAARQCITRITAMRSTDGGHLSVTRRQPV